MAAAAHNAREDQQEALQAEVGLCTYDVPASAVAPALSSPFSVAGTITRATACKRSTIVGVVLRQKHAPRSRDHPSSDRAIRCYAYDRRCGGSHRATVPPYLFLVSRVGAERAFGVDGLLTTFARIESLLGVWIRREGGTSSRYSDAVATSVGGHF